MPGRGPDEGIGEESMEEWVECPCCGAEILIDLESGTVLSHKEKKGAKGGGKSFKELLEAEEERQKGAESRLAKAFKEEKEKKKHADRRFREAVERAKEEPDRKPPLRDVDLD
jgi:hypothetical protein